MMWTVAVMSTDIVTFLETVLVTVVVLSMLLSDVPGLAAGMRLTTW
jgi:hypothetical protein